MARWRCAHCSHYDTSDNTHVKARNMCGGTHDTNITYRFRTHETCSDLKPTLLSTARAFSTLWMMPPAESSVPVPSLRSALNIVLMADADCKKNGNAHEM